MIEHIKINSAAFDKAAISGDYRQCEPLTRQFENWCRLHEPK